MPESTPQNATNEFIRALTGNAETPCTWQYFDDLPAPLLANSKRGKKRPGKAGHFYATLAQAAARLTRANADRCGVFVTVNETDGLGREASNITRIRAVFIDCDGFTPTAWHLPPSIVVQSRNGPHAYWLVNDCSILEFADAQRRLALHYGSDGKVCDPSRVMRLPGFQHCKAEPHRVTLIKSDGPAYAIGEVLATIAEIPAPQPRQFTVPTYPQSGDVRIKRAAAWLAKRPGAIDGQGGNSYTFGTAAWLVRDCGLSESEAWPLLWAWNDTCDGPWTERDLRMKLADAVSKGTHPVGSLPDRPKPERPKPLPPGPASLPRAVPSGVNRLDQLCDDALAADPAVEWAAQQKTFQRGGEVELGLDLAATLGARDSVVCAENRIWQFNGATWTRWEDETLAKSAQGYDGKYIIVPARELGDADKHRPITLSAGNVKGIVQNCKTTLFEPKFFAEAPIGAPFENMFARIKNNEIIIEKMTRSHRVKSEHAATYPLAPLTDRSLTAETLLNQTWAGCDDFDQRIQYFWEWLGAAICGIATRYKDTPLLVGPKDTGKSQILHMISTCFPVASHRAITLHAMSSEYHRAHLSGGRINFVNELPARELMDGEAAKAILSGEMVNCRHPAEKPFDWVPRCAHVFAANELPPSRDSALMDRLVLLDCANVVPRERQDRNLQAKLTAEAPQIAATALAALPGLLARGHLIRPGSAQDATHAWQIDSNPIRAWANESLMQVNDFVTQGSVLYNHFCAWAKDNGHRAPASNLFAARLKAIGFAKETRQVVKWNAEIKSDARRAADGVWGNNSRYGD